MKISLLTRPHSTYQIIKYEQKPNIRSEIYYNIDEFKSIINNKKFTDTFKVLQGEQLKRPPTGYPKDFPDIDLLKFKSFTVVDSVSRSELIKEDFLINAAKIFKVLYPYNQFLNHAIDD